MSEAKKVLVVDDDEMVANVISLMLAELGHESRVEGSPQAALEVFTASADDFDVVITDLTMPKINGVQLAASLKAVRPDIPVLVMSGYTGAAGEIPNTDLVDQFLSKPLLLDELEKALLMVAT